MIIPTNVIVVTTVLKTISSFLNTLKNFHNCFDRKKQLQIYTNNFHKALKCNYCGKLFTHAGHIKTVHEGDKDFKCESCGKLFTQANSLTGYTKLVVL